MSIVTFTMNPAIDISAGLPRVLPTRKLRCTSVRRDAGGGGINAARVIARLGGEVRAMYPVGGPIGDLLRRLVEAEGVASETIDLGQDTRESFTIDEGETGQQYRFVLPGPTLSRAESAACLAKLTRTRPSPTYFVASGSLPAGLADDFLARAARTAKTLGARVIVDSSGPALAAVIREGVYLVKPNLRELQDLAGFPLEGREQWLSASRALIEQDGAEVVALTLGHLGGLLVTREEAFYAPAVPVKTASAVGAGDSFLGAMVWSLAAGHALNDAFSYGMAAGSAALLSAGTELCKADDVRSLFRRIRLEPF